MVSDTFIRSQNRQCILCKTEGTHLTHFVSNHDHDHDTLPTYLHFRQYCTCPNHILPKHGEYKLHSLCQECFPTEIQHNTFDFCLICVKFTKCPKCLHNNRYTKPQIKLHDYPTSSITCYFCNYFFKPAEQSIDTLLESECNFKNYEDVRIILE